MSDVLYGYPAHLELAGPVFHETSEIETDLLTGVHLDFYYARATGEFETVAIDFLPAGPPHQVRVGSHGRFINFKRNLDEDQMRKIVKAKFGDKVLRFTLKVG